MKIERLIFLFIISNSLLSIETIYYRLKPWYQLFYPVLFKPDHFYTVDAEEVKSKQAEGYVYDYIVAYVMGPEETNCKDKVQIKGGYDPVNTNHFYTTNISEAGVTIDTNAYCVMTLGKCSASRSIVRLQNIGSDRVSIDDYYQIDDINVNVGRPLINKGLLCYAWPNNSACGEPPPCSNGKLSPMNFQRNINGKINPGQIVTCTCNHGYMLSGSSGTMTCSGNGRKGVWVPQVSCIAVLCYLQDLKKIQHNGVQDTRLSVQVDYTVLFRCAMGSNRYPYDGKNWYNNKNMKCTVSGEFPYITCAVACDVPVLTNGQVKEYSKNSIGKVNPGTTAKATCKYGFKLNNGKVEETLICHQTDGLWDHHITCERILCYLKDLKDILYNGVEDKRSSVYVGYTVLFKCATGSNRYPYDGKNWYNNKDIKCTVLGKFPYITCAVACDIPVLENGHVKDYSKNSIGKVNPGTTVTATCNSGFKLNNGKVAETLTCQQTDSRWLPNINCKPFCYIKDLRIRYSFISPTSQVTVDVNNDIDFACKGERYPKIGKQWLQRKTVKCVGSLTWEQVVCSAACELPVLANGEVSYAVNAIGKVNAGDTGIARCHHGYRLNSGRESQTLTCQEADSKWTPEITCKPVCYLTEMKSVQYGVVTGISDDQTTVDLEQSVNFNCTGLRYPDIGPHHYEWWTSPTMKCIDSNTWEHKGNLRCSAACEVPKLKDGKLGKGGLNKIGKYNAWTKLRANCDYGYEPSNGVETQMITCQQTDSQWLPNITCLPRCKLICFNFGTCYLHSLDWQQRCICPIGFTGELCEIEISDGSHTEELLEIKDQMGVSSTLADMEAYVTAQMSYAERYAMRVPSEELISDCTFAGKSCPSVKHNDLIQMGSCYTINYDPKNTTTINRAGRTQGLRVILYNNETEFVGYTLQNGMKLIIHKQGERLFPENQGRLLAPGFQFLIPIKYVENKRYKSKCASEEFLKSVDYFYDGEYTIEGCLKTCYQKKVIAECGCGDPRAGLDPKNKDLSYCSVKERNCVNSVSDVTSADDCICPEPCSISLYEATYTSVKWPAKNYRVPLCERIVKETMWKEEDLKRCNEAYRNLHIKIDIYYKELSYQVWTEYPSYTLANFWSDFGNLFDLFFGVGYISFFELAVFLWHVFFITVVVKIVNYWRRMFVNNVNPVEPQG